ncbi:MAG: hypothetical protein GY765_33885 [bacterium]|nr:hypothetical protein [bacterium]
MLEAAQKGHTMQGKKISPFVMKLNALILAVLFLPVVFLTSAPRKWEINGVRIIYPQNTVFKNEQVIDFERLEFSRDKKVFLRAYVGNHPQAIPKQKYKLKKIKINKLKFRFYTSKKKDGTESGEVLITIKKRQFPCFIHFWYFNLSQEEKKTAMQIIKSVSIKR